MTDEQRSAGDERRQAPADGDSVEARMQAMMRRCADMTGYGTRAATDARTGEEDEEAEPAKPPCSCR